MTDKPGRLYRLCSDHVVVVSAIGTCAACCAGATFLASSGRRILVKRFAQLQGQP